MSNSSADGIINQQSAPNQGPIQPAITTGVVSAATTAPPMDWQSCMTQMVQAVMMAQAQTSQQVSSKPASTKDKRKRGRPKKTSPPPIIQAAVTMQESSVARRVIPQLSAITSGRVLSTIISSPNADLAVDSDSAPAQTERASPSPPAAPPRMSYSIADDIRIARAMLQHRPTISDEYGHSAWESVAADSGYERSSYDKVRSHFMSTMVSKYEKLSTSKQTGRTQFKEEEQTFIELMDKYKIIKDSVTNTNFDSAGGKSAAEQALLQRKAISEKALQTKRNKVSEEESRIDVKRSKVETAQELAKQLRVSNILKAKALGLSEDEIQKLFSA